MSPTFSNTPSKVADVAPAPAELTESFTEPDSPKTGRLLSRVFGSTIKRAANRVIKTKTDMEAKADEALENALTRHKESCVNTGESIRQGFSSVLGKLEHVKDGSAVRDVVSGKSSSSQAEASATSSSNRFETILDFDKREAAIENALTKHSDALNSAATGAVNAKQRVSKLISRVAEGISTEAGAGLNVIRKSAAYKVAMAELSMELGTNLRKNETLTPEQKQNLRKQITLDADAVKQHLSEKIESILVDNKSVDISRSSIRGRLQEVVEESVDSISELTQDLRSLSAGGSLKEEATHGNSSSSRRSTIVDAVGGTFSSGGGDRSTAYQPQQDPVVPVATIVAAADKVLAHQSASATTGAGDSQQEKEPSSPPLPTVEKQAPVEKQESVAQQQSEHPSVAKTATQKPDLKVVQGGKRHAEEVQTALGKLTSKQLIYVAQQLKATEQPELTITKLVALKRQS